MQYRISSHCPTHRSGQRGQILTLLVSGFTALLIGGALLFSPVGFAATSGIELAGHVSQLSETRSSGGLLAGLGVLILAGAASPRQRRPALLLSATLYLGYGLSRLFSMMVDGMPADPLVQAAVVEGVLGGLSLFYLLRRRSCSP